MWYVAYGPWGTRAPVIENGGVIKRFKAVLATAAFGVSLFYLSWSNRSVGKTQNTEWERKQNEYMRE